MQIATHGILASSASAVAPSFSNLKSLVFDGVDDFVDCGSISAINSASTVSISYWGKKSAAINKDLGVGTLITSSNGIWLQWYTDNNIYFTVRNGSITTTSYSLTGDTNWHNIIGVYNGSNSKIYVDGSLVATGTSVPSSLSSNAGNNFKIGSIGSGFFTSGNIDEVAVFNSELSASNVTSIYNSGSPADLTSLSPISWWRNGDSDTYPTLNDNGSGSNNGTMTNMTSGDIVTDVP